MGSGFISAGKANLYCGTEGEGTPLLFIHAGVADSRMWRHQKSLDGIRSICFDKRGFGQTTWVDEEYSDTEDSLAVLDGSNVQSAVIVGCSMGGATALDLAIDHPHRVDGLVLIGTYPSGWVPDAGFEESPLEAEAEAAMAAGDYERVVEIEMEMWLIGYGRDPDAVPAELKDEFRSMDRIPVRTETQRIKRQRGFEKRLNNHLDSIDTPVLVIVGEHDEPLLVDAAHYLARHFGVPPIVIPGAAHLPSLEQPTEFNTALLDFVGALST